MERIVIDVSDGAGAAFTAALKKYGYDADAASALQQIVELSPRIMALPILAPLLRVMRSQVEKVCLSS